MSNENLHLDDQSKKVVFLFLVAEFSKEIDNMFSVFLSSYRNIRESLGELGKAVETLAFRLVFPQHFSFSQTSSLELFQKR